MTNPTLTDDQLIEQIQQGDKVAFRQLFDRYYQKLLATAINVLKDVNAAKDATQEVFLQIWKNRESLHIKSAPAAYLKRAVINRALNQIKSRKKLVEESQAGVLESSEPGATQVLEAEDLQEVMQKALDQLPERCRIVFVMRRLEGMRVKEIAQQLGISPKTVENQLTKALKVLKEAVLPFVKENSS